ncbi:hypothetical protein MYSI104531_24560 [Mycobacterium simiae]
MRHPIGGLVQLAVGQGATVESHRDGIWGVPDLCGEQFGNRCGNGRPGQRRTVADPVEMELLVHVKQIHERQAADGLGRGG